MSIYLMNEATGSEDFITERREGEAMDICLFRAMTELYPHNLYPSDARYLEIYTDEEGRRIADFGVKDYYFVIKGEEDEKRK